MVMEPVSSKELILYHDVLEGSGFDHVGQTVNLVEPSGFTVVTVVMRLVDFLKCSGCACSRTGGGQGLHCGYVRHQPHLDSTAFRPTNMRKNEKQCPKAFWAAFEPD